MQFKPYFFWLFAKIVVPLPMIVKYHIIENRKIVK